RIGLASALASSGRLDEAIDEYRKVALEEPNVRLTMARLLYLRNLRLPPAERRWNEVEDALKEYAQVNPDSLEVPALRAEVFVATGKLDEARQLIEAARDKHPRRPEFWLALVELAERQGDPAKAAQILNQAAEQLGDTVEIRLARARMLARD